MFGLIHRHHLTYRSRRDAGGGVTAFELEVEQGAFRPLPGQHVIAAASATAQRPLSLASAPEEDRVILGTSLTSGSAFKQRLAALREGDRISVRGPIYTYAKPFGIDSTSRGAVFLAQGVGITPFRSLLAHLELSGARVPTTLVHVASDGHAFREETASWATRSSFVSDSVAFRGTVRDLADGDSDSLFYVAGAPAFVSATVALLRERGVGRRRIRDEKYVLYNPRTNLAGPSAHDLASRAR